MKKRIISLLLSLIVLMQAFGLTALSAEVTEYKKEDIRMGLLTELGIVNPDKMPAKDREVTRGEFADYAVKLYNGAMTAGSEVRFWDVGADYDYKDAVNILTSLGCIDGYDDGSFSPNAPVNVGAAVKIMVCMLGYAQYSEVIGGYHNGYMELARMIDLIPKDFPGADAKLTTDAFVTLFYNALNAPVAEVAGLRVDSWGNFDVEYSNAEHKTMLENYWNIKYIEGVVEANSYTSLYANGNKAYNAIRIGGKDYTNANKAYDDYLGYRVSCFYEQEGVDGPINVRFVYPTQKTTTYTVSPEDDPELESDRITYYEGSVKKYEKFDSSDIRVLKNGRPINYVTEFNSSLFNIADGNIVMIDNDDDGLIEVIKVTSYNSMIVSGTNLVDRKIYVKSHGDTMITLDEDDYVNITDTLGNSSDLDALKEDTVISVAASDDGAVYNIIISYDYVEGKITSIATDGLYYKMSIDSVPYKGVVSEFASMPQSAKEYIFYLSASGYIVAAEAAKSDSLEYGYLLKIIDDPVDEVTHARIITGDNEAVSVEFGERTKIDGRTTLRANVKSYFDTKFPVPAGESYYKEIIRYSVNEDGKFREIDTAIYDSAAEGEDTLRYRYVGNKFACKGVYESLTRFYVPDAELSGAGFASLPGMMYGALYSGFFQVSEPALIGSATEIDADDVKIFTKPNFSSDSSGFNVKTYSINDDTQILCGIVVKNGTAAATKVGEGFYVVTGKTVAMAPDEEARMCITLSDGKAETELFVSENYIGTYADPATLQIGDVVRYGTDFNGYADKFQMVFEYSTRTFKTFNSFLQSSPRVSGGLVYDVDGGIIRVLAKYKNASGVEEFITPTNAETAIDKTYQDLLAYYHNNSAQTLFTKSPTRADAVAMISEIVPLPSLNCYEVVRDEVVFSTITPAEIQTYKSAGSDCSTLIIRSNYGNMDNNLRGLLVK